MKHGQLIVGTLYKVRSVLNSLVSKFKLLKDRYGTKAYLVSELKQGYICNMEVYSSKSQPVKDPVFQLLGEWLLSKGHHLYQDSYYNC